MARVYVIIVTYNALRWVDRCFGSLAESIHPVHVLVIDNGSVDDTVQVIHSRFPFVELVRSGRNLGFGQANNLGISMAMQRGADYLMLLNQDAWIQPATIDQMIEGIARVPDTAILSPLQLDGAGKDLDLYFRRYLSESGHRADPDPAVNAVTIPRYLDVAFINAAAWFMPAHTIQLVGGFDPVFFHYGEDRQFASRVRYRGGLIRVDTQAVAYHDREERIRAAGMVPSPTLDREWVHYLTHACDPALKAYPWFAARRGLRHFLTAGYGLLQGNGKRASLDARLACRIWGRFHEVGAARRRSRQSMIIVPDLPRDGFLRNAHTS